VEIFERMLDRERERLDRPADAKRSQRSDHPGIGARVLRKGHVRIAETAGKDRRGALTHAGTPFELRRATVATNSATVDETIVGGEVA